MGKKGTRTGNGHYGQGRCAGASGPAIIKPMPGAHARMKEGGGPTPTISGLQSSGRSRRRQSWGGVEEDGEKKKKKRGKWVGGEKTGQRDKETKGDTRRKRKS